METAILIFLIIIYSMASIGYIYVAIRAYKALKYEDTIIAICAFIFIIANLIYPIEFLCGLIK